MSTGEGGGPGDEQGRNPDEERQRTPPPRRRTPPPRRRTPPPKSNRASEERGEQDPIGRQGLDNRLAEQSGSLFSRLFGRKGLDNALADRFRPYEYESTRPTLRWLFLGLLLFIAAGAFAVYADMDFKEQVNEWRDGGFTELPIDNEEIANASFVLALDGDPAEFCAAEEEAVNATPTPDPNNPNAEPGEAPGTSVLFQSCGALERVFEHAEAAGIDCTSHEELQAAVFESVDPAQPCEILVDMSVRYDSIVTTSNTSTILVVLALVLTAFPFSTFIHRSSRNLRTMKSEGQKKSPDGAVARFFIPIINVYQPLLIVMELFKASDPRLPNDDPTAWQRRGRIHPTAIIWGLLWPAFLLFNSFVVARAFVNREDLEDITTVTTRLLVADGIVIALGIAAALMARSLSRWQEERAAKYGTVTVTPPRPRDPLEKILEEGATRREPSAAVRESKSRKRRRDRK